nr:hypothetical protein [Actinopolyspora mortivallis]
MDLLSCSWAALRAAVAELADPLLPVANQDKVLTTGDYLSAYVLEWTLHHPDLVAHLPGAEEPPVEGLARSREMPEEIAGFAFPASLSDKDVLRLGTGRRVPSGVERAELGGLAARLPFVLG